MALGITVPYQIVVDSGPQTTGIREGSPREGPWAEVKFKCLWDDRYQLCSDLLGTWLVGGTVIIRQPAFLYPSAPQMFCTDILDITPLGKPIIPAFLRLPWMSRQLAIITARFSIPGYTQDGSDQSGQPYTKLSLNPSGEFFTLPDTTYWFADGTPCTSNIGIMIPQIDFCWKRHKLPIVPDVAMASLVGCVNSDAFAITKKFTAAVGTVLFIPGMVEPDGNVQAMFMFEYGYPFTYTAEYHFHWRSIPWNYMFHPNRTSGFQLVTDGNGDPPYTPKTFTNVLP
jgi:hypothetical protein